MKKIQSICFWSNRVHVCAQKWLTYEIYGGPCNVHLIHIYNVNQSMRKTAMHNKNCHFAVRTGNRSKIWNKKREREKEWWIDTIKTDKKKRQNQIKNNNNTSIRYSYPTYDHWNRRNLQCSVRCWRSNSASVSISCRDANINSLVLLFCSSFSVYSIFLSISINPSLSCLVKYSVQHLQIMTNLHITWN